MKQHRHQMPGSTKQEIKLNVCCAHETLRRRISMRGLCRAGMILALLWASAARADVYYVKADATGAQNGTSWVNAFTDLQAALAAVQWDDQIWVAAGTYKPTTGTDPAKSFVMPSGVAIYGGFAGGESALGQRNWVANPTILSGNLGSVRSNVIVTGGYKSTLDGVSVSGGTVGMSNQSVSPTIAHCTFTGNINSGGYGGGMVNNSNASPTVTDCSFTSNTSIFYAGGGMYNAYGSSPKITNCIFANNQAEWGGAISCESTTITNCVFTGNVAGSHGGAMYITTGAQVVRNCTFTGNTAKNNNSGPEIFNSGSLMLTNCIIWGDKNVIGPLIFSNYKCDISHCDIQGCGQSGASWDNSLGTDGGGNIDANPRFLNAAHPAGTDGRWYTVDDGLAITTTSLCINAGLAAGAPASDILGRSRVDAPDIGAYEYLSSTPTPTEPQGRLAITYTITHPSIAGSGQNVLYTYHWTSDGGDSVSHGPTSATADTLAEMDLVQAGETWTVTVTPGSGGINGPSASAKVKILNPQNGAAVWLLYR